MADLSKAVSFSELRHLCEKVVEEAMDRTLEKRALAGEQAGKWVNQVCDSVIDQLQKVNANFKYIVSCVIAERREAEVSSAGAYYWDRELDGSVAVQRNYPNLSALVTVFGVAF
jgi:dynein light chain Tctex-type 1